MQHSDKISQFNNYKYNSTTTNIPHTRKHTHKLHNCTHQKHIIEVCIHIYCSVPKREENKQIIIQAKTQPINTSEAY